MSLMKLLDQTHFCICVSDRVFHPECNTRQVYEEGAKQVALSVLRGINCTRTHASTAVLL
jgi:hypothetical protein